MPSAVGDIAATQAAPDSPHAPRRGRTARYAPVASILLAPLLGLVILRAPVINVLFYRDPWFYSGHGWALSHFVEVFGWFYYAVRFPANLPIGWSTDLFGAVAG